MESSEDIKKRIIETASERFLEEGFSRVSVEEIVAGLGMSKKTFYKHFESKDDLLKEVAEQLLNKVRENIRSIVEGESGFLEKLDALMTFLGRTLSRLSRPMMRDLQRHSPEVWNYVQQFRRERISVDFKGLLRRGVAEGLVRSEVDIDLFLMAFIGAVDAVVNPAVLADQPHSAREVIRSVMTIFFRGILTDRAGEAFAVIRPHQSANPIQ